MNLIEEANITYVASRGRRVGITINSSECVVVKVPNGVKEEKVRGFVESKKGWIEKILNQFKKREKKFEGALKLPKGNKKDFLKYKKEATKLVGERLKVLNERYGFRYEKVTVRDAKSRWGSCSKKGNLNFNYRIIFLPSPLCDYLVIHELCHLREFNHSKAFWELVARTVPDYKKLRRKLRHVQNT